MDAGDYWERRAYERDLRDTLLGVVHNIFFQQSAVIPVE